MGDSLIINVLVYRHSGGSPVTSSIVLKINICDSPNNPSSGFALNYVWVYTPIGAPKQNPIYSLHANG